MLRLFFCLLSCSLLTYSATAQNCNTWLGTPAQPSFAEVGQVNITGTTITVEASFIRTTSYVGGQIYAGDLVSKHNTPADANYLLRPNNAEITTSNGYFRTPEICEIELNKTYHVAMVYDGATLKFYRNGFLMSQVAASGTLFQNNWKTRIGWYEPQGAATNFIGYINEVRIWNTTKTQSEIRASMGSSLPNPTGQAGLVAYYTFNNLLNKQGNAAYNAVLGGGASINATNPNCVFVADSCGTDLPVVPPTLGGIVNNYTPVLSFNPCENKVNVEDGTAFKVGDTVLMIQMKGAVIDSSNTAAFGTVTDFKNAGNYEFNYIKSVTGNTIDLLNNITRTYDVPTGKVQLIRVPYFNSANITSTLTCLAWDGSKGGVLVINVKDTLNLAANIDISGNGFRGGNSPNSASLTLNCFENGYNYPVNSLKAAAKGEGISSPGNNISWGKGAPANGGGGGVGHNSGGGGGSNGGVGGLGGYQLQVCGNAPFDNRGLGGRMLPYSPAQNKIFMGGGGGSGHVDNAGGSAMPGGNGGGIIIINTNYIKANGFKIISNGGDAEQCDAPDYSNCHDGSGGGGAGGTILINNNNYLASLELNANGGKGANLSIYDSAGGAGRIGPGGGGGAGIAWFNNTVLPGGVTTILSAGVNGVITADNNNPWGATPGQPGINVFNLVLPVDNVPYQKNIDSVVIHDTLVSCARFNFGGIAYTKTTDIVTWQWDFGDNTLAYTQNTSHTYTDPGTYNVKLRVTDINGCMDSTTLSVSSSGSVIDFSYKQDICNPLAVQFSSIGEVPGDIYWSFGDGKTSSVNNVNTVNVYAAAGIYTVKYAVAGTTCSDTITKTIPVTILPEDIIITKDTTICFNSGRQLFTRPALSFCWSPTTYLDNPAMANPVTSTPVPITYFFTAEYPGTNLINNGDFSAGNTGFTSAYNYAANNITEGQYFVGPSPTVWNGGLSNCSDHTTGNGNMMLVNGAPVEDVNVWAQTVAVTPNTNYAFSTWIQALYPPNPAQLSFSINGGTLGNLITASLPTCTWNQFYTTWNSGNNTSATISIVNKNTFVQGNDFALDDISFAPVLIKRDSVKISIDTPQVKTIADTTVCEGIAVQLNASGTDSYSWTPVTGVNNPNIVNPVAQPVNTTQFIVTGKTIYGCTAADTVNITIQPKPVITMSADSTICRNSAVPLFATGGNTYAWLPATSLNNTAIPTPVATPASDITYTVTVTNAGNCSNTDSVKISLRPLPAFTVSPAKTTCFNKAVTLSASGGDSYLWSPAALVDDPASATPVTNNNTTTLFTVKITSNACDDSVVLSTTVNVRPVPVIRVAKSNDIDCIVSSARLSATGANTYVWSPVTGLNNPNIATPTASLNGPQQFTVTGTDTTTGCTGIGTLAVLMKPPVEPTFFIPNAFSPNGDGKNDCFRVKQFGTVKWVDVSIFNRFGTLVFHSLDVNDCWDGTVKGSPANPGNYVYYIKTYNDCGENIKKGNLILIR